MPSIFRWHVFLGYPQMSLLKKLKISNSLILAPMSGITSYPYRLLNRRFGCPFAFLEMVSARALSYLTKRTVSKIMYTSDKEKGLGIQLVGEEAKYILEAMDHIDMKKFDILDLNAGCPNKKVVNKGGGSALLKEPRKLQQILKIMVRKSSIPVTVKIRSGWDEASVANIADIACYARDAGIEAISVHGRTRFQGYSGRVDYKVIKKVKDAVDIPVIASGDIFTPELVKKMFDETGCDAVMAARGTLGNPWLFKLTSHYLKTGNLLPGPDIDEIIDVMKIHLKEQIKFYEEKKGIVEFRKFYIWYTRGFLKVKDLRNKAAQVKTEQEMLSLIEEFQNRVQGQKYSKGFSIDNMIAKNIGQ